MNERKKKVFDVYDIQSKYCMNTYVMIIVLNENRLSECDAHETTLSY